MTDETRTPHLSALDFKFPDDTRYPTLPIEELEREYLSVVLAELLRRPEIELAQQLGCQLTLKHGVAVPQDTNDKVFFEFIKDTIRKRDEAPTKIENSFWKELTNSATVRPHRGSARSASSACAKGEASGLGERDQQSILRCIYHIIRPRRRRRDHE